MASYKGHLVFSSTLGAAYATAGFYQFHYEWGESLLAAGITAVGGLLPDLDSDSGVPVRELFGLAATVIPIAAFPRVREAGYSVEQTLVLLAGLYIAIRYGVAKFFRHWTVHRGMFHSVPAMLVSGLAMFIAYHSPNLGLRCYLSGGIMLGFLSHLVLDEIYSVDFMGVALRLNKYAGSALKFFSPSWPATLACYTLLAALGWVAWQDWSHLGGPSPHRLLPRHAVSATGGSSAPSRGGR